MSNLGLRELLAYLNSASANSEWQSAGPAEDNPWGMSGTAVHDTLEVTWTGLEWHETEATECRARFPV